MALDVVSQPFVAPAALGLVLVLGAAEALYFRQRVLPIGGTGMTEVDQESLLLTLANFDDAFAIGAIPEREYQEQLMALKARLRELLADRGGLPSVTREEIGQGSTTGMSTKNN